MTNPHLFHEDLFLQHLSSFNFFKYISKMYKVPVLRILMVLSTVSLHQVVLAFHNSFLPKQSSASSSICLFSKQQKEGEEDTVSRSEEFLNEMAKSIGVMDLMKSPTGPQDTKSKMKQWAGEYDRDAIQVKLNAKIENSSIFLVMYGECPYCKKVLRLLEGKNVNPKTATLVDLDTLGMEKYALRYEVIDMVNQTTVPALWIGGQFIGGYDDLSELDAIGELENLMEKAGALH